MIDGDAEAIFGGIIVTNFKISEAEANLIRTHSIGDGNKRIIDGILAPEIDHDAIEILSRKGGACKMYACPDLLAEKMYERGIDVIPKGEMFRFIEEGFITQGQPKFLLNLSEENLEKVGEANEGMEKAVLVAQVCSWTSNSNNICLAQYDEEARVAYLIANGNNQTKRIAALDLAIFKAEGMNHQIKKAVMASDSFCPFPDVPKRAGEVEIAMGFIPKKGMLAEDVFAAFKEMGITTYSMHDDECRGFAWH